MINKNQYRKTDTKKVLHKVGKQWKVVSVALLMAIAGGAVATHAANADAVNDQPYAANQAQFKPSVKPASAKPSQSSASASVEYYPAESGSAAMYFDKVASDNSVAAKNFNTVNAYVQSLNNEYGPQVNSYSAKSTSASDAAKNDAKLASSFSAVNNNPATAKTVNSLAAKNHFIDPQLYQGMVQGQEEEFSDTVSSASNDVNAASDVSSLVNLLEGTNLSAASLSASASAVLASSDLAAANANLESVNARYGNGDNNAAKFVDIANKLSAGANTLNQMPNDSIYNANVDQLNVNAASTASLGADLASDVNDAVSNATNELSTLASNAVSAGAYTDLHSHTFTDQFNALNNYAGTDDTKAAYNDLVGHMNYTASGFDFNAADTVKYNTAVSAAVNPRLAGAIESVATSLYGKYNPQYATSAELSAQSSAAERSAENKVTAAKYAYGFASANSVVVSNVASATSGKNSDGVASVVNDWLQEGVTKLESNADLIYIKPASAPSKFTYIVKPQLFEQKLEASLDSTNNGKDKNVLTALINDNFLSNNDLHDVHTAKDALNNLAKSLQYNGSDLTFKTTGNNITSPGASATITKGNNISQNIDAIPHANQTAQNILNAKGVLNAALGSAVGDSTSISDLNNALRIIQSTLSSAADNVFSLKGNNNNDAHKNGLNTVMLQNPTKVTKEAAYAPTSAALLSDGINLSQLESASAAIGTVAANVKSASTNSSDIKNIKSSAAQFSAALSVANSSANSALGSAQNASEANSTANDDNVTLASYFATSYSNAGNSESAVATSASSELNSFFVQMANDPTFDTADAAYAGAEAAAANDKKLGIENAKFVYNNAPHFLDVLKGAKLHSSYDFGSNGDKVLGSVNKGDRLTVLGVNFNRNGLKHGATRYLVKDNTTGKTGFFTGQPQFSKAAYLNAVYDTNNVDVSIKTLKPVTVYDNLNGGKAVKTLKAGTVVDGVTIVSDNPSNDAMGYTKVEDSNYNFFTANTDYVELNTVVPKNNNNNNTEANNFAFNLSNVDLGKAYNNNSQY